MSRIGQITRGCCASVDNQKHEPGCLRGKFEKAELVRAAAPELLEACKVAARLHHDSGDGELCTDEQLCLYCAAIAKAECVPVSTEQ